jgi:Protein of unknown function (DUF2971)
MKPRTPGKRSFFKYTTPETAISILERKTVKYSSPLYFNDPFDVQSGLHLNFDLNSLAEKTLDRLSELITADKAPSLDATDPWGKAILLARQTYGPKGFDRERWQQRLSPSLGTFAESIAQWQVEYQQKWTDLLPKMRVFCVAEDRDNLLMWAHYAKDHTGAVFEFLSLPDEDNPLSVARKVKYVKEPPSFLTRDEWIDDLLSLRRIDLTDFSRRYVLTKSSQWRYEKEWRAWYPHHGPSTEPHTFVPINPHELSALYLGCQASQPFLEKVVPLARSAFPQLRLFQARKSKGSFSLEYTEA